MPWLILAACLLLALQPRAAAIAQRHISDDARAGAPLHAGLFVATLYGGYFGAGLGIVLLALLGVLLPDGIQRLNALKGVLSLLVAAVSAVGFVLFGPVAWDAALIVGADLPARRRRRRARRPAPARTAAARRRDRLRRRGGDRDHDVGAMASPAPTIKLPGARADARRAMGRDDSRRTAA